MITRIVPAFAALLVAAPALAADLPSSKAPPVFTPAPIAYDWTGFYLGVDLGGVWAQGKFSAPGGSVNVNGDSVMGGGFLGYNRQYGNFVVGLEGDVQGLGVDKSVGALRVQQNLLAAINGRLGYAFDRVLVYAIGGAAFTDTTNNIGAVSINGNTVGYDVGGGVEYAFLPNWTLRAEYRYYDFGKVNRTIVTGGTAVITTPWSLSKNDNTFRVGLAYKFGAPAVVPVVAKY